MQAAEEGRIAAEAQLCAGREARLAMESHLRELEARDVQRGAAVVPAADEGDAARRVGLDDLTVGERRERPLNRGFLGRREDIGGAATAEVRPAAGEGDAGPAAARTNGSGAST